MAMPEYSFDWSEFYVRDNRERQYFDAVEFPRGDNRQREQYLEENPRGFLTFARLPTESSYWTGGDQGQAAAAQDSFDDDMSRIRRTIPNFKFFRANIRNNHWF